MYLSQKFGYERNTQGLHRNGVMWWWVESTFLFVFLLFQSFSCDNNFPREWDIGGTDGMFAFDPP